MLDLMAPLGRPPLDTYSPTQIVRTAEPMPAGIWELEIGVRASALTGTSGLAASPALPSYGVRYGLTPNLDVSVGEGPGRNLFELKFAPIPALWSFYVGGDQSQVQAGTIMEVALPWLTPRLSFRASAPGLPASLFGGAPGFTGVRPSATLGAETRVLRFVNLGADIVYSHDVPQPVSIGVGATFRPIGNLGLALYGGASGSSAGFLRLHLGSMAAIRF